MTIKVTNTFHVVDELPGDAAVACRDEEGDVHVYLSRRHPLERIAADLSWVYTALADADYVRSENHFRRAAG